MHDEVKRRTGRVDWIDIRTLPTTPLPDAKTGDHP
jgi:hypothetical protein